MVKYDFDRQIERRGTGALKTDALEARYGKADLLPLWVADMDFETPPFIIEALRKRLEHPILGYTIEPAQTGFGISAAAAVQPSPIQAA